jgi:hypothetical protein
VTKQGVILYVMDGPCYQQFQQLLLLLFFYTKCTQATDMMVITHGVPRHFSSNTCRLPGL